METNQLAQLFKALSCQQRFNLFLLLLDWCGGEPAPGEGMERCFTRACETLHLSRSTISHHFRELEKAGLIDCTRSGQHKICRINGDALSALRLFAEHVDRRRRHAENGPTP